MSMRSTNMLDCSVVLIMILKIGLDRLVQPLASHSFGPIRSIRSKSDQTDGSISEPDEPNGTL